MEYGLSGDLIFRLIIHEQRAVVHRAVQHIAFDLERRTAEL
jgi:hypothetical protein